MKKVLKKETVSFSVVALASIVIFGNTAILTISDFAIFNFYDSPSEFKKGIIQFCFAAAVIVSTGSILHFRKSFRRGKQNFYNIETKESGGSIANESGGEWYFVWIAVTVGIPIVLSRIVHDALDIQYTELPFDIVAVFYVSLRSFDVWREQRMALSDKSRTEFR